MYGTLRVWFEPGAMTGRIKSSVPARLVNGGTRTGTLRCKPTKFEFLPNGL